MRAKRTACALLPCLSERTAAGGEIRASASISSPTSGPASAEVAVAAVALGSEHPALDQLAEVGRGGRRGHARLVGEHARRQCAAVAEREQDARPAGIGDEGSDARDVGVAVHAIER